MKFHVKFTRKLSLIFFGILLCVQYSWAEATESPLSWSEFLKPLETDLAEQSMIWRDENQKTNLLFNQSKNKAHINATLGTILNQERVLQQDRLNTTTELFLIDRGLSKSMELVLRKSSGDIVLISNLQYRKNNSITFFKFILSPNKRYVVVIGSQLGSTDFFNFYVIDIEKKKIIADQIKVQNPDLAWSGLDRFIYTDASKIENNKPVVKRWELVLDPALSFKEIDNTFVDGQHPVLLFCNPAGLLMAEVHGYSPRIQLNKSTCSSWMEIIKATESAVTLFVHGDQPYIVNYKFLNKNLASSEANPEYLYVSPLDQVIDKVKLLDDHYLIQSHWGIQTTLQILNRTGKIIQTLEIPQYTRVSEVDVKIKNESVLINLETAARNNEKFIWDYKKNSIDRPMTEYNLMRSLNVQYKTEILQVKARDGVLIPVRVTRLSTTQMTSQTPVFMEVYGGFNQPGFSTPYYSSIMKNLFMNRGGVLVGPAIRGGDEFGPTWHKAGIHLKKMNTYHDVIDVAEYFIKNKWTRANKIILTGTSNGGLTAAASAFLSPESFGLVIPVNGVYDLLALNYLDGDFGKWWQSSDYGKLSDSNVADYMKLYAPLEANIKPIESLPNFLFVNGLNDSRVNPLHTLKMMKKLRIQYGNSEKIHAVFLKNGGHWAASSTYQDQIALRENALLWAAVYKQLDW